MNKGISCGLLVIALLLTSCQSGKLFEGAFCLENIGVIDALTGLREGQTVVIKDDRIIRVASSTSLKLDRRNTIIDGRGKYLIPGLWDTHVHFAFIEALAPRMLDLFLTHGVTSVRDIGGNPHFVKTYKDLAKANPHDAPRVMMAGPLLDGMPNVYDGSSPFTPALSVGLIDVAAVEMMVDSLIRLDVDLLKAYEMLSPEQFARLAELARENELKVTGHVPLSMDVRTASDLGLSSMEHMRNLELACASNADDLLQQRRDLLARGRLDPGSVLRSRIHDAQRKVAVENFSEVATARVMQTLAANETWQIPTLALGTASSKRPFLQPQFLESFAYLGDSLATDWEQGLALFLENEVTAWQSQYSKWLISMIPRFKDHGITIMAGTDCPIFFLTPGVSLHEELRILVEAGLSPLDALAAATVAPARYFDLQEELGSIADGMLADLVILRSNPLEDINNTRDIEAVIRNGKLHDRSMLDDKIQQLINNE